MVDKYENKKWNVSEPCCAFPMTTKMANENDVKVIAFSGKVTWYMIYERYDELVFIKDLVNGHAQAQ